MPTQRPGEDDCDLYRTPARPARAELRDRGSRFLAVVQSTPSAAAAEDALSAIRAELPGATHHCWAWRLGHPAHERSSDDGEPSGTAGVPILQVLRGAELSDVTAVVVRWYGGTKLGKGGLARAYAGAVRGALEELPTRDRFPLARVRLALAYDRLGAVERLVRPPEIEIADAVYGERVELSLVFRASLRPVVEAALADLALSPVPDER